ncbi:MAG: HAD family hydrolase [Candidatus Falkowbacteria bacterium]|nr:HAD family hydrolase [Candidatus Falkowbacteria bacterium]
MVKAILFDVDGVLLDSFEANLKFFQVLISDLGHQPPTREEYQEIFNLNMIGVLKKFTHISSEEEFKKICELRAVGKISYPTELLSYPESLEEVVHSLNQKYSLGIVTSRITASIFESPRLKNLKEFFPIVVACEDTKLHKPDPAPLLLAAEKLSLPPEDIVYVGDQKTDLQAARSAGMKIIMYSPEKFPEADRCTSKFSELLEIINHL